MRPGLLGFEHFCLSRSFVQIQKFEVRIGLALSQCGDTHLQIKVLETRLIVGMDKPDQYRTESDFEVACRSTCPQTHCWENIT